MPNMSQSKDVCNTMLLEGVADLSCCRFFGSFEPIFDSNLGGNIDKSIYPPKFEVEKRPK